MVSFIFYSINFATIHKISLHIRYLFLTLYSNVQVSRRTFIRIYITYGVIYFIIYGL